MKTSAKKVLGRLVSAVCGAALCCSMSAFALTTGVVNSEAGLRLREEATVNSKSLAVIEYGDEVDIISTNNGWCYVSVNGTIGYMALEYLDITTAVTTGVVNVSAVNLREAATTESKVIEVLHRDAKVTVLAGEGEWYKVRSGEDEGYIHSDYLDIRSEAAAVGTELYICGNGVNFRETASLESEVIKVLPYGTKVVLVNSGEEWTEVKWDGKTGFVYSVYLTAELSGTAEEILAKAAQYLGTAYVYGGSTPAGFDCSGLTQYVFAASGIKLSRSAHAQISDGVKVSKSELLPGDLVFFSEGNTGYASHVGIYAGNGAFIHSSNRGVVYNNLTDPYYSDYYMCACRVL